MGELTAGLLGFGYDSCALLVDVAWEKDEKVECRQDEEFVKRSVSRGKGLETFCIEPGVRLVSEWFIGYKLINCIWFASIKRIF